MAPASRDAVIGCVLHAAHRHAAGVRARMSTGVSHLATIASTAPWLGLLFTVEGIVHSFHGCGGEKGACLAAIAESLSNSLVGAALGLGAGIVALVCYRMLRAWEDEAEAGMRGMALAVANQLSVDLRRPRPETDR